MATRAAGAGSGSGPAITARVARSGGAIVAALLLAKLFSTLKESFVAQAFGVGREVDAYVLASALSLWVATIVGNGIDGVAIPLLKQAQDTKWPKLLDVFPPIKSEQVLDHIERVLKGRGFWVFTGPFTPMSWRMRRWFPGLMWWADHHFEGT